MLRPWRYPEARRRIAPFMPGFDPPGIALRFVHLCSIILAGGVGGLIQSADDIFRGERVGELLFGLVVFLPFVLMFRGYYCQSSGIRFIIPFRWFWAVSSALLLAAELAGVVALLDEMTVENGIWLGVTGFLCALSLAALWQSWRGGRDRSGKPPGSVPV